LNVVNRWGQEVYSSSNYKNDWDGRHNNGEELPEGTYFYILKHQSINPDETGFVVIKRD
jgi:gliding motility-associated-like protein